MGLKHTSDKRHIHFEFKEEIASFPGIFLIGWISDTSVVIGQHRAPVRAGDS